MQQPVGKHRCGSEEQAEGLVAGELEVLGFAAGFAFLLDSVALELVVHLSVSRGFGRSLFSGSIAKTGEREYRPGSDAPVLAAGLNRLRILAGFLPVLCWPCRVGHAVLAQIG